MKQRFASAVLVIFAIVPAAAHHSMAVNFDLNKRISQNGVLEKIEWTNPHVHLYLKVKGKNGATETWAFEGPAPGWFRGRSYKRSDFEDSISKTVAIDASPARNGSNAGLIRQISLPNGIVISACPQNC